jgi:hypothetical protein
MKTALMALFATVAAFGLTSIADAGHCGGYGYGYSRCHSGYCAPRYYAPRYGYGYNQFGYLPYSYNSWSQRCWFPQHNCYGYYCPQRACWYYFYQPFNRYLPVQYMSQFAPVQNQNININTNVNSNANVALPPGATAVPTP